MERRFLIVDDCVDLLQQVSFSCDTLGWETVAVTTAQDALHALRCSVSIDRPFDAVIVDVAMPDCGGAAFLMRIRVVCRNLPVVVVTGAVSGVMGRLLARIDGCVVLEKPVTFGQLLAAVDRATVKAAAIDAGRDLFAAVQRTGVKTDDTEYHHYT